MPTLLPEGDELDDDPGRIDVDAVHRFVTEAYWAKGRSRDVVAAAIAGSVRVVGLYHRGEQVGFARVVSDGKVIAYLADVYVLEEHRGHGLGQAIVQAAIRAASCAGAVGSYRHQARSRSTSASASPSTPPSGSHIVVKIVNVFDGNLAIGLPSHQAVICAFDADTGTCVAILDATVTSS